MALNLKGLKTEPSIKLFLHKAMPQWEPPRGHNPLHASDLMKDLEFCPREYALLDATLHKKADTFIGTAQRATFAHGKDMEDRVRNEWLRSRMLGNWKCQVCNYLRKTLSKAPMQCCPKCNYERWEYSEVRFLSPHFGVSGGIDAIVDVGETKHRLLEIKSIDKDAFKELKAPLAEHKFRTSLYLRLLEDSELGYASKINVNKAHILYVSKSYGFKDESIQQNGLKDSPFSPFKEFVIQRDDAILEPTISKVRALHHFRKTEGKAGFPCGVCTNSLSKRAQKCNAKQFCWTGKFTSTITWIENGSAKHPDKHIPEQE